MHCHTSLLAIVSLGAVVAASAPSIGCYSTVGSMESQGHYTFQTIGYCTTACTAAGKTFAALTNGTECLCGDELPPSSSKVADSACNTPCAGFAMDNCGGSNAFSIFSAEGASNPVSASVVMSGTLTVPSAASHTTYSQSTLAGGIIVDGGNSSPTPTVSVTNPGGLMSTAAAPTASSSSAAAGAGGSSSSIPSGSASGSASASAKPSSSSNSADRNTVTGTRASMLLGGVALLFISL